MSLEKYLNEDELNKIEAYKAWMKETRPSIMVIGHYNAGKSSLLNALTGHFDDDYFPVADKRETSEEKEFKNEKSVFIDTPGLNATEMDDDNTLTSLKKADYILFTHSAADGALTDPERDILENILRDKIKIENGKIIFVLTKKDGHEDENIEKVIEEMQKQIGGIFKVETNTIHIIPVSTVSYVKAMKEDKTLLAKRSNFSALRGEINKKLSFGKLCAKSKRICKRRFGANI